MPEYVTHKMPHGRPNRMPDGMPEIPDNMSAGGDHSKKISMILFFFSTWFDQLKYSHV